MLAANDLRIGMSARRRKSPDADRRERRYSSRSPPRWRSPPTAMRSDKHTETRLPDRDRDRDRDRERRDDREPERRDDRERERCDNRGRESERRDEREREHRDDRERHAPKRWREGGRWMQMYVGDGIGMHYAWPCVHTTHTRARPGRFVSECVLTFVPLAPRRFPCGECTRRSTPTEERCSDRGRREGPKHR
jgi:hypothetical protein